MRRSDIIVAIANPQLRTTLLGMLAAQAVAAHAARDFADLLDFIAKPSREEAQRPRVLVLEEAFIYPHVYEECAHIKAASRQPLTIVLLVEPRTRTRSDWMGADHILRLPMPAGEIAARALEALRGNL